MKAELPASLEAHAIPDCVGVTLSITFHRFYPKYVEMASTRLAIHVGNLTYNDGAEVEKHLLQDIMKSVKPWIQVQKHHIKIMWGRCIFKYPKYDDVIHRKINALLAQTSPGLPSSGESLY